MVDDPNKTESGSFMDDDYLAADDPATSAAPQKVNVKEIIAQNPMLKVVGIVGIIVFVLIAYMVFGGSSSDKPNPDEEVSSVRNGPDMSQVPGTAEPPPAYEEALRQSNEQIAKNAEATGESAIPTPIARPSERIEAPVQVEENDPLSEWRREAENRRIERQQQDEAAKAAQEAALAPPPLPAADAAAQAAAAQAAAQPQNPPLPTTPTQEQVSAYAQQLMQQMQIAIDAQTPKDSVVVSTNIQPTFDPKKYTDAGTTTPAIGGTNGQPMTAGASAAAATPAAAAKKARPIIDAGTIAYAQILTEANSDVPGPVLAEIASGPLLGGRAIGTFQVAEKHLVLQFNRIVKDGVEYQTQTFALDPSTTLPGVVSEVNNHYFSRIMLPAAAAFISGFAEAATQKDTQVVVSNGTVVSNGQNQLDTHEQLLKGAQEAGNKLSDIVDEDADRPRTVIVHAGTRIGLLFVNAVIDPDQQTTQYANQQNAPQNAGQAIFNATPYGQAYNAYQAYQGYQQQQSGGSSGNGTQGGAPIGLYSNATSNTSANRIQPF